MVQARAAAVLKHLVVMLTALADLAVPVSLVAYHNVLALRNITWQHHQASLAQAVLLLPTQWTKIMLRKTGQVLVLTEYSQD
jgi:hypothetical protein